MGRPINKKWFGDAANGGAHFELVAKVPGKQAATYPIVKQRGTSSYIIEDSLGSLHTVFLTDKTDGADLLDGEASLVASINGEQYPVTKITGRKIVVKGNDSAPMEAKWTGFADESESEAKVFSPAQAAEEYVEQDLEVPEEVASEIETVIPDFTPSFNAKMILKITDVDSDGAVTPNGLELVEHSVTLFSALQVGIESNGTGNDLFVLFSYDELTGEINNLEASEGGTGYKVGDFVWLDIFE